MNSHMRSVGIAADRMLDNFLARLPALILGILVFLVFYGGSILVSRLIRRATHIHRHNVGIVFARVVGTSIVLLGFLVSFSIVTPSFQAGDLIKFLGIGSVAISFAFQNILQNFLAGLLLLWTEPFRVGDQIKLDEFEGTVEDIETRATKRRSEPMTAGVWSFRMRTCSHTRSPSTPPSTHAVATVRLRLEAH